MFKWSRLNHNVADEDLNCVSSSQTPTPNTHQVASYGKDRKEHPFKSCALPSEVVIKIVSFMDLKTLFSFAATDQFLLKFLFNQSPSRAKEYIKLKSKRINSLSETDVPQLAKQYKKQEEEKEFEVVQREVWKPLVCYYFPQFEKSLNVKNWMHVLRRRVNHLKLYAPSVLPLSRNVTTDPFKFNVLLNVDDSSFFIEGCEFNYK